MKKLYIVLLIIISHLSLTGQTGTCASGNSDGDMICNSIDNCPYVDNDDQSDVDGDGVGDVCDNSPLYNPDQADIDGDGIGDVSDPCIDPDKDGVCGNADKCPGSDDRIDVDRDGIPDGCDSCIDIDRDNVCDDQDDCIGTLQVGIRCDDGDPCTINDRLTINCQCVGEYQDSDNDGVCDALDKCEGFDDSRDYDNDGIPDGCDEDPTCSACQADDRGNIKICHIPLNPDNMRTIKGSCNEMTRYFDNAGNLSYADDRCGPCQCSYVNDIDSDGDGVCDRKDRCPNNPNKVTPGKCGCDDQDTDGDGICDSEDKCPGSDDRLDSDQDGIPDGCDDIQYCTPEADNSFEKIVSIIIAGQKLTDESNKSYILHATPVIVEQQKSLEITVELESIDDVCEMSVNIYIDRNQDGDYNDAHEKVASDRGQEQFNFFLDVEDLDLSTYRMRVVAHYGRIVSPCQPMIQGEVEDFLLLVSAPPPCTDIADDFDYIINSPLDGHNGGTGWEGPWETDISGIGQITVLKEDVEGDIGSKIGIINLAGSASILRRQMTVDLRGSDELVFSMIIRRTSGKGSLDIQMGLIHFGITNDGLFYLDNLIGNSAEKGSVYYLKMKVKLGDATDEILFWADTVPDQMDESKALKQFLKIGSGIEELKISIIGDLDFDPLVTYLDQINLSCTENQTIVKAIKNPKPKKNIDINREYHKISTYPNPSKSGKIVVNISGNDEQKYSSKIVSSQGVEIWEGILQNGRNAVTLEATPSGVYFLVVISDSGIMNKKIFMQ